MTGWIVSRLDKNKVEAVNEAGNARFVFIKSGRAWDGACVSLEELNGAFARMGLKPDAELLAKMAAAAGDALRLFLASERGQKTNKSRVEDMLVIDGAKRVDARIRMTYAQYTYICDLADEGLVSGWDWPSASNAMKSISKSEASAIIEAAKSGKKTFIKH